MSGRSKTLARYIRKERAGGPEQGQSHDTLLDKGFSLLKNEPAREFHNQIKEVNHEPGCIDALGSAFGDTEGRVFKLGEETKGLAISFNTAAPDFRNQRQGTPEFLLFHQSSSLQGRNQVVLCRGKAKKTSCPCPANSTRPWRKPCSPFTEWILDCAQRSGRGLQTSPNVVEFRGGRMKSVLVICFLAAVPQSSMRLRESQTSAGLGDWTR